MNKILQTLFSLLLFSLLVCNCKYLNKSSENLNFIIKDGIYFEKSSWRNNDNYTSNNSLYKAKRIVKFSYKYLDKNGISKYCCLNNKADVYADKKLTWELSDTNSKDCIKYLTFEVLSNNSIMDSSYMQSVIDYKFYNEDLQKLPFSESTGLVENYKNIWIHPPRSKLFAILELNPFPYIKLPIKTGNKWQWKLEIGDHWSDNRWKSWKGNIINNYTYKIKDKVVLNSMMGEIDCFRVFAVATNKLGKSSLVTYFNSNLGFVKLEYINIDSSQLILEMIP